MQIKEALAQLDVLDDGQWTADGAPKVEVVSDLIGHKVTRNDIVEAAPLFNRENFYAVSEEEEVTTLVDELMNSDPMEPAKLAAKAEDLDPEDLQILSAFLDQQRAEAELMVADAEAIYKKVKVGAAYVKNMLKRKSPDLSNQEAIQAYIEKQAEVRGGKMTKAREIRETLGLDIKYLDPRTPLDRAMARKTNRGASRPNRGLMT